MKTASDEIREKGFAILRRELTRGEFARFLQSLYKGKGDYTAEREELLKDETLETVLARIRAGKQAAKRS